MGAVADGCVMSCLPQGGYRGPNPTGPLVFFPPFLSRQKGCACAAQAQEDFIILKGEKRIAAGLKPLAMTRRRENGLPQPLTRLRNDKKTGCICSPFNNLFSHAKAAEYFICYLVCNAPAGKLKQGGQRVVHADERYIPDFSCFYG